MRTRLLACVLVALMSACVKRVAPSATGTQTTISGLFLRFGEPQEVPEGTQVLWSFGDGTPDQQGASVDHAFPRAGVYTVVETIKDKDGQTRSARTHVTVLRRAVQMAVPADVRAALMVPTPWKRLAVQRGVAAKLSLGAFFDEVAATIGEAAGFDVLDSKAADANGFDPDEGVVFFTVPQDPEALVFAVGTHDDAKALEAAKRLLTSSRSVGRYGGGPFQLRESQLASGAPMLVGENAAGDKVGVLQRAGYLYLRLAGATDPALALRSVVSTNPEKGLLANPGFVTASRHIGEGDAIFFSRPDASADARLSNELSTSAFAVYAKPDNRELVQVRMFSQLRSLAGDELVAAFKPLLPPPDLASRLPSGAAAYLRISAAPQALWRELTRTAGADAQRLRDRVQETAGLDLEKDLIPSFSGNVGIGVYLDAASLIEAILGEQVGSFDRSAFLVAAQLKDPQTVQAALDRAMKSRPASDRAQVNGASWFRLGDGAQAAIKEGVLFLSLGGQPPAEPPPARGKKKKKAAPPSPKAPTEKDLGVLARVLMPSGPTLGQEFKRIGVAGFEVPGQENIWLDIAGIVRSIERAGGEQGGVAGQGARLFADRAGDLRDALFEARPGKEGIDADLWLRFLPQKKSAGR
ncbi:MAG TPA: PKD domain-containing protein [Myxococcales bacterium]|jgi:PKD repeat protein|nr:PKD domain-containing protein [Myxococcales bacterium]